MPYKRKDGKWVAQVRKEGKRKEKIFPTKTAAKAWENEQQKENWEEKMTPIICLDWANEYLKFCEAKFSRKTVQEKSTIFRRLFKVFDASQTVSSLTKFAVMSHLKEQSQKRSGYAANKDRKNLLAAWNWGIKYLPNFPNISPFLVDKFPEKRSPRYIPSQSDFWKVYEVAEGQDRLMLLAYLYLGARRGELFQLSWEDVDFGQKQVRLATRKRKDGSVEYDWLPLLDELHKELLAHKEASTGQWVFTDPESGQPYRYRLHWMKRLCKRAEVRHFGIHAIRHLTASILADKGVPIKQIQFVLRHKNLSTTEKYTHLLSDLRSAMRVLERKENIVYVGRQEKAV